MNTNTTPTQNPPIATSKSLLRVRLSLNQYFFLTSAAASAYAFPQVLKTPETAVKSPRQRGFFTPIGFGYASYGRECDGYNTRKGTKSAHLLEGFELPPTRVSKARHQVSPKGA